MYYVGKNIYFLNLIKQRRQQISVGFRTKRMGNKDKIKVPDGPGRWRHPRTSCPVHQLCPVEIETPSADFGPTGQEE